MDGRTKWFQLIAGVVLLFLGILAAFYLTRHLTVRINKLRIDMCRIADGDLSTQIAIHANDEIGELGRSINRMQSSISSMIAAGAAKELLANAEELQNLVGRFTVAA